MLERSTSEGIFIAGSVLNIGYRRYIDRQNYNRIPGDISWYGSKYSMSYRMKNMHIITYINHIKLV